ncbi:MAG: DUF6385 domain-containing protein [Symbiobacteriia bacterium]
MPNFLVFNKDVDSLRVKVFGSSNTSPIQVDGSGNLIVGAGTVTITGGTISALSAGTVTIAGGTVNIEAATVTVSGGTINTVVALNAGTVTVSGGTIGALSAGTVTISGGTITTVSALAAGTVTVSGGTIDALSAGTVTISGGTISALSAGTVTVTGGSINLNSRGFTEASETVASTTTALAGATARDVSDKSAYSFFVHNTSADSAFVRIDISPDNTTWYADIATSTLAGNAVDTLVNQKFLKYARVAYATATAGGTVTVNVIWQAQV